MLSEMSQTEKDKRYMILHMWNLKQNKFIETESRLMVAMGWGWRLEEWVVVVKGVNFQL